MAKKTTSSRKNAAGLSAQVNAWENDPFAQSTPTNPPVLATPIVRPGAHARWHGTAPDRHHDARPAAGGALFAGDAGVPVLDGGRVPHAWRGFLELPLGAYALVYFSRAEAARRAR